MRLRSIWGLRRDEGGATIVEFALVAPFMIVALLGVFDLSFNIYASSILKGVIQKAARDSTIQGATSREANLDARVTEAVRQVVPSASLAFERSSYTSFADVARPEDFTDTNGNGNCDDGEPFEDVNGNNIWDNDRGRSGFGGARDAVLYTVTVTYNRRFPMNDLIGLPATVTTDARTVLRNQPYSEQNVAATVGNCV